MTGLGFSQQEILRFITRPRRGSAYQRTQDDKHEFLMALNKEIRKTMRSVTPEICPVRAAPGGELQISVERATSFSFYYFQPCPDQAPSYVLQSKT